MDTLGWGGHSMYRTTSFENDDKVKQQSDDMENFKNTPYFRPSEPRTISEETEQKYRKAFKYVCDNYGNGYSFRCRKPINIDGYSTTVYIQPKCLHLVDEELYYEIYYDEVERERYLATDKPELLKEIYNQIKPLLKDLEKEEYLNQNIQIKDIPMQQINKLINFYDTYASIATLDTNEYEKDVKQIRKFLKKFQMK